MRVDGYTICVKKSAPFATHQASDKDIADKRFMDAYDLIPLTEWQAQQREAIRAEYREKLRATMESSHAFYKDKGMDVTADQYEWMLLWLEEHGAEREIAALKETTS